MNPRATQQKGDVAVSLAKLAFNNLGFDVSQPTTESATYDLIVEVKGALYKVQVKFTSKGRATLQRTHSNAQGIHSKLYKEGDYDWLFIVKADGSKYVVCSCLAGKSSYTPKEKDLFETVFAEHLNNRVLYNI
jgi:hypothetical protein